MKTPQQLREDELKKESIRNNEYKIRAETIESILEQRIGYAIDSGNITSNGGYVVGNFSFFYADGDFCDARDKRVVSNYFKRYGWDYRISPATTSPLWSTIQLNPILETNED